MQKESIRLSFASLIPTTNERISPQASIARKSSSIQVRKVKDDSSKGKALKPSI